MSRRRLVWLAVLFFVLHNGEEAIAFKHYVPRVASLLPGPLAALAARLSYPTLLVTLVVVSVLGVVLAVAVDRHIESPRALWAFLVFEATVGINAVTHVFSEVVLFRGYGPGVVTAVLLNASLAVYSFRGARREGWVAPAALRATVPAALILHGPVLLGGLWLASVLGG